MSRWILELAELAKRREAAVLVTVARVRGSAPREPGARMIVTATETIGTIGGGRLEYDCAGLACRTLQDAGPALLRRFPLGASFGQCCGGVVDVLFQPLSTLHWLGALASRYKNRQAAWLVTSLGDAPSSSVCDDPAGVTGLPALVLAELQSLQHSGRSVALADGWLLERFDGRSTAVAVFGAGHVGAALVRALSPLDLGVRWIDSRRGIFGNVPAGTAALETPDPVAEVGALPPGSVYAVMTHSHALDYAICARILARDDAAYAGLIGSTSKRRRFEKRFLAEGLPAAAIRRLVCPIGIGGISGKEPAVIAAAVTAQILRALETQQVAAVTDNVHRLADNR